MADVSGQLVFQLLSFIALVPVQTRPFLGAEARSRNIYESRCHLQIERATGLDDARLHHITLWLPHLLAVTQNLAPQDRLGAHRRITTARRNG
jgi:hypothetical protein